MDQGLFISLLNPAIALVLAFALVALWSVRRESRYILLIAASYLGVALGFVLQTFEFGMGFEASRLISVTLFFASTFLLGHAVLLRQGLAVPVVAFAVCCLVSLTAFCWLLVAEPHFVGRIFAVNFGIGTMCLILWWRLRSGPNAELIDRILTILAGLRALDFFLRPVAITMIEGDPSVETNLRESAHWLATSLSAVVFSITTAILLMTMAARDVMAELREESHTDPLSRLLNRRGFDIKATAMLQTLGGSTTAVVIADIDHFKAVNDRHGHAVGDLVIRGFAAFLRSAPAGSVVARIGGEEFAVFLPHCTLSAARLFAEGVRTACASGPIGGLPEGRPITASFGVAQVHPDEDLAATMRRADAALYAAKMAGRDCVRTSDVSPVPASRAPQAAGPAISPA
ncbi:MAG: GGDEF domain-containing protein [Rhizobiaceae bacterium]|nr:GGDEF domain-containing protein [Rhizobiaceae bacterium]